MTTQLSRSESESSVQETIFNTLLRTPHRQIDETLRTHLEQYNRDPYLYGKLSVHAVYKGECTTKDIQDIFIAVMFISEHLEHRNAAWVMFQDLPPYRAVRVLNYITGYTEIIKHTSIDKKPMPSVGVTVSRAKYSDKHHDSEKRGKEIPSVKKSIGKKLRGLRKTSDSEITIDTWHVRHKCLGKNRNRVVQSAVENYVRYREANRAMMEGAIIRSANSMRSLYAKCHLLPGKDENSWINQYLFHKAVPEESRLGAIKELINSRDPVAQARLIMDNRLPYPVVRSLVSNITPSVLVSLINSMSSQELLSNLSSLKRDGAFDNPEIAELIRGKIGSAKKAKKGKVDAFKAETALENVTGLDEETKNLVTQVTDTQLKSYGKIGVPTALLVDKSASMTHAIELAKKIAAAIAQAGGDNFAACYLFNNVAVKIDWAPSDGDITAYSAWNKKLRMHRANGATHMCRCIQDMIRNNIKVDQIVLITDQGDNGVPSFGVALSNYKEHFGVMPNVVIVHVNGGYGVGYLCNNVERSVLNVGGEINTFKVSDIDKISLPNLIQMLSKKSIFDLVQDILGLSLPAKEDWYRTHQSSRKTAMA